MMRDQSAPFGGASPQRSSSTSPEGQIAEARKLAQEHGFDVPDDYVIGTDWGSEFVWDSPPML